MCCASVAPAISRSHGSKPHARRATRSSTTIAAALNGIMHERTRTAPKASGPICSRPRRTCSPARSNRSSSPSRSDVGRRRHRQRLGNRGVAAEQHEHAAELPVVQRHAEHRQKADAKASETAAQRLPQRGKPCAAKQHGRARRKIGTEKQSASANRKPAPSAGPKPGPAGPGPANSTTIAARNRAPPPDRRNRAPPI